MCGNHNCGFAAYTRAMDAVTQLQNFTRTVAGLMANTLEETQTKSPLLEAGQDLSAKHHEEVEERARRLFQLMQDGTCTAPLGHRPATSRRADWITPCRGRS